MYLKDFSLPLCYTPDTETRDKASGYYLCDTQEITSALEEGHSQPSLSASHGKVACKLGRGMWL